MNTKICSKCKKKLSISVFYKDKSKKDKLQSYCILCKKESSKKYIQTEYGKLVYKKASKKYLQSPKGKKTHCNTTKIYQKNNPEKRKARSFITNLIQGSILTRDICTICGKPNAEFHHENYDLPNFGYWFCKEHHNEIHNGGLLNV